MDFLKEHTDTFFLSRLTYDQAFELLRALGTSRYKDHAHLYKEKSQVRLFYQSGCLTDELWIPDTHIEPYSKVLVSLCRPCDYGYDHVAYQMDDISNVIRDLYVEKIQGFLIA